VIGKGVIRFHAVYWPAILLSAGLRLPSELLVHGYVTIGGQKISKSLRNTVSPAEACAPYGADALRYYLLRHIGSRRDGDFSWARFGEVYTHELANDLGNLVSRTTALGRRYGVPDAAPSELAAGLGEIVSGHIEDFALDRALDAIWAVVTAANAYVNRTQPWRLAQRCEGADLERVLAELYAALASIAEELAPFLPATSQRLATTLGTSAAEQLFPRRNNN
jgi:methionyl-tRNA synthetase